MHYVDEGHGPAVVLLHGNPTWSFYYRHLILGLRDRYRVIAPDHLGCGLSDKPQKYPYTLATHVANLERLLDHLQLEHVTLGMHDWGGAIGMGWAVSHAERVRGLVVFNSAAFFGPIPWRIRMCRGPLAGRVLVQGLNLFLRASFRMASVHRERWTPEVRRGYLLPYRRFADRVAIRRFVQDIPIHTRDPSYAELAKIESALPRLIDRPMAMFWGAKDFCFHDGFLKEWQRRFPRAEVHRFEDAGHYVVEDAHEGILPLLREFLTQLGDSRNP
jgi:haloalkane dehalogenase